MHGFLELLKGALILPISTVAKWTLASDLTQTLSHPAATTSSPSMSRLLLLTALAVPNAMAFPWVAGMSGIRSASEVDAQFAKRQSTCPFNPNHVPAAPITAQFPYAGAQNGLPSTFPGNFQVPANGDTAHAFVPPGPNDIRGPCPGLNTAANHNVRPPQPISLMMESTDL